MPDYSGSLSLYFVGRASFEAKVLVWSRSEGRMLTVQWTGQGTKAHHEVHVWASESIFLLCSTLAVISISGGGTALTHPQAAPSIGVRHQRTPSIGWTILHGSHWNRWDFQQPDGKSALKTRTSHPIQKGFSSWVHRTWQAGQTRAFC